jgi:hypothetical protein
MLTSVDVVVNFNVNTTLDVVVDSADARGDTPFERAQTSGSPAASPTARLKNVDRGTSRAKQRATRSSL